MLADVESDMTVVVRLEDAPIAGLRAVLPRQNHANQLSCLELARYIY